MSELPGHGDRKPTWLRMPTLGSGEAARVRSMLRKHSLETVCDSARCPNTGHCFQRGTATFLILGPLCTRACRYCAIENAARGAPAPPDPGEPERLAAAAAEMGLLYVVVTSVTRDDLTDGGAGHFAATIRALRETIPGVTVEVLTPDFRGDPQALRAVAEASPDVFNHNLETVDRLFPLVRPGASYRLSLEVLAAYGRLRPDTPLKSGLMLGLGEADPDIERALGDLRHAGVTMLTLGQYLQPTKGHWPVDRYLPPEEFQRWKERAEAAGFLSVASGPLVRSSFHADAGYRRCAGRTLPLQPDPE
jgi:lipoyl synthase